MMIAKELANFMGAISHPHRIRLIEELRGGEMDVATLSETLGLAQATTSQHLSLLKSRKVLISRRDGHRVYYRLSQPKLATWLVKGLNFLEEEAESSKVLGTALKQVRSIWSTKGENRARTRERN